MKNLSIEEIDKLSDEELWAIVEMMPGMGIIGFENPRPLDLEKFRESYNLKRNHESTSAESCDSRVETGNGRKGDRR